MSSINISKNIDDAIYILQTGGIAVIKTDTLYGILANALDKKAVDRVYRIKARSPEKPFIILVPSVEFIKKFFDIEISGKEKEILEKKGITVVLRLKNPENFIYLHRGTGTLAFRIPDKQNLIQLLQKLDLPLIAPSANPEGKEPATNIQEAIKYFLDQIDIYIDEGVTNIKKASPIVKVENNKVLYLRK